MSLGGRGGGLCKFKRKRSTASLSLTLQTLIAQALDDDNYAVMASLDLSAAFDMVNISLLLKRLKCTNCAKCVGIDELPQLNEM